MTSDRGSPVLARREQNGIRRSSGEDRLEGTTAKSRRRWEDNIKLDLEEIRWG